MDITTGYANGDPTGDFDMLLEENLTPSVCLEIDEQTPRLTGICLVRTRSLTLEGDDWAIVWSRQQTGDDHGICYSDSVN